MNAESKQKDGDLNAKQLNVLKQAAVLLKAVNKKEDLDAEYASLKEQIERFEREGYLRQAKLDVEVEQETYNKMVKEVKF